MKVKELIKILSGYPDNADIVIWAFRDCDPQRLNLDIDKKWMRYDSRTNLASIDAFIKCGRFSPKNLNNNINNEIEHIV